MEGASANFNQTDEWFNESYEDFFPRLKVYFFEKTTEKQT